jgi:hypothetical protein
MSTLPQALTCSQEAIALLMACRRFGIEGADATIRKMLPLVFSRDPGTGTAWFFPRWLQSDMRTSTFSPVPIF